MQRTQVDDVLDTLVGKQPKEQYENISSSSSDGDLVRATPQDEIMDRIKQNLVGQEPTLPRQPVDEDEVMNKEFIDYSIKKEKTPKRVITEAQKAFTNDLAPIRRIDQEIQKLDEHGRRIRPRLLPTGISSTTKSSE